MSSVAQQLPPEILYQILRECGPSTLLPDILAVAPLNHSLVCRSWRAVALERCDLWATIQLSYEDMDAWFASYPNRTTHMYEVISQMWRFWLGRSGEALLDIDLQLHVDLDERILAQARLMYKALHETQHRWRSVAIEYMNMTTELEKESSELTLSRSLENLTGSIHRTSSESLATHVVGLDMTVCDHLRCVTLNNFVRLTSVACQLQCLRILKVKAINIDELILVLERAPNLEVLSLSQGTLGRIRDLGSMSTAMISLPALSEMIVVLYADDDQWRQWNTLLRCLCCPSLIKFRLVGPNSTNILLSLQLFFSRSRPQLEYLSTACIHDPPREETDVLQHIAAFLGTLRILPSLVFLEIEGYHASASEILQALRREPTDNERVCPLLCRTLENYEDAHFHYLKMSN